MKIELAPWMVPNFVHAVMPPGKRQDGFKEAPSWPIAALDAEDLAAQCARFREDVFQKAGKADPARAGASHAD